MAEQLSISSPRLLSKIEASLQSFSPNDRRIADYLLVAYPQTTWETVEEVAQAAGVSKSAVVRLATRLGYDGFQELQRELQTDFAELLASPALLIKQRTRTDAHVVTTGLERALDNLQSTYDRLTSSKLFDEVAARLTSCEGQILVLGMRKSFGLAAYLQYLLSSARSNVRLARPDTASFPESLVDLGPKDIVVAISVRRYTRTTLQAMEYARGAGVYVVAISDTVAGPAAARADVVLAAASEGVLLFDSAISIVFILEALANSMVGLAYDDALDRLELSESIGRRFALFESATTPASASTQLKRPRAARRRRTT
jgi:DNA-binding MurR/RpiR family transcriptional regulator